MRQIKFRVWDKEKKKFGSIASLIFLRNGQPDAKNRNYTPSDNCFERFIFLQFTGLKDSKGREIYEGDIIQCPYIPEQGKDEFWERGLVRYYPEYARFGLEFYSPYGGEGYTGKEQDISDFTEDWELVGNMFENPELLT